MRTALCLLLALALSLSAPGCCGFNPFAIVEQLLGAVIGVVSSLVSEFGMLWMLVDAAPPGRMEGPVMVADPMTREEVLDLAKAGAVGDVLFLAPGETPPREALSPPCEGAVLCLVPLR